MAPQVRSQSVEQRENPRLQPPKSRSLLWLFSQQNLPWTAALQSSPGVRSNACPLRQWCHPIILLVRTGIKESKMLVAKRQRKEKPAENGTKEIHGPEWEPQAKQTALLSSPIYIQQAQREEEKHIKEGPKLSPSLLLGQFAHTSGGCHFPLLANKPEL